MHLSNDVHDVAALCVYLLQSDIERQNHGPV